MKNELLRSPLALGAAAAATAAIMLATAAFAQDAGPGAPSEGVQVPAALSYPAPGTTPAPMVVETDASGTTLIRGTVASVADDRITISGWGGDWTVRLATEGSVAAQGTTGASLSGISAGDFIGAQGVMAADAEWTIDASFVRNWTTDQATSGSGAAATDAASGAAGIVSGAQGSVIPGLPDGLLGTDGSVPGTSGQTQSPAAPGTAADGTSGATAPDTSGTVAPTGLTGTVSSVGVNSFFLTDQNGFGYTIMVDDDTSLMSRSGTSLTNLSDIQSNDTVEVSGTLSGNTLTATEVRNVSR